MFDVPFCWGGVQRMLNRLLLPCCCLNHKACAMVQVHFLQQVKTVNILQLLFNKCVAVLFMWKNEDECGRDFLRVLSI